MESDYVEVQYSLQPAGPNVCNGTYEYHIFAAKEVITVDTHTCKKIVVSLCITGTCRHGILFVQGVPKKKENYF